MKAVQFKIVKTSKQFKFFFSICPPPGLLPVLGLLERYRLLHLTRPCLVALGRVLIWVERRIIESDASPRWEEEVRCYKQLIRLPGVLQFKLRHRVSSTEWLKHHTLTGFDPPIARTYSSTECENGALTIQATTAGQRYKLLTNQFESRQAFNKILNTDKTDKATRLKVFYQFSSLYPHLFYTLFDEQ